LRLSSRAYLLDYRIGFRTDGEGKRKLKCDQVKSKRIKYREQKMLVLSRYCDESVCIGDDIVITVVDVRNDRVRLGIKAPPNVSVHRQEVYDAITREKNNASGNNHNEQIVNSAGNGRSVHGRISGHAGTQNAANRQKTRKAPLEEKLSERRGKALPVEIETHNISLGGMAGIMD
jgi:carbon storage regulator